MKSLRAMKSGGGERVLHERYNIYSCQSEWPSSKCPQTINAREGVEKREPFYTVGGNVN